MKKTHDANIGGTVFHIDEDAYVRLETYLKSVASYFATFPDHADITADIEGRIAEQLVQESGTQRIVTITAVENVISKMGRVEQFAEADGADVLPESEIEDAAGRRQLYRDMDGRIIAGVASGLAAFVKVKPIVVRLLFVALFLLMLQADSTILQCLVVLTYLAFWAFVPATKTTTDNLRMRGSAVTLAAVERRVRERLESIEYGTRSVVSSVIAALGSIIHKVVLGLARFACGAILVGAIGGVIACTVILVTTLINERVQPFGEGFAEMLSNLGLWSYPVIFCIYIVSVIPLLAIGALVAKTLEVRYRFKIQWGVALFAVWFVSLLTLAGIGAGQVPTRKEWLKEREDANRKKYEEIQSMLSKETYEKMKKEMEANKNN